MIKMSHVGIVLYYSSHKAGMNGRECRNRESVWEPTGADQEKAARLRLEG